MASVFYFESNIDSVPENILLDIFQWLPIKDLCTIGRVCRKWRRVISDNSLWRHVDLRPYKLNLHKIWKVIRAHFSDVLLSLRLRGYTDPASINWKKHSLSDAMLRELQERCPSIVDLELVWTSLEGICVTGLPHRLQKLTVTHSLIPVGWFLKIPECECRDTLTYLDLSHSTKTTNSDLKDLVHLTNLSFLNMNFCYRISEAGLKSIADNLKNITVLEIAETRCTDLAVHHISRGMVDLERLNLSGCSSLTDAGLATLGSCLKKLKVLHLVRCERITDLGMEHIPKIKTLKECDVTRTKITVEGVHKVKAALKDCQVIGPDEQSLDT